MKHFTPQKISIAAGILLILLALVLPSCYSIRIANIHGTAQTNAMGSGEEGYWADKEMHVIDTTVSMKIYEHDAMFLEGCESGGFHAVEYRVTFGDVLWNALTLGTRKKVRVRYVCVKPQS